MLFSLVLYLPQFVFVFLCALGRPTSSVEFCQTFVLQAESEKQISLTFCVILGQRFFSSFLYSVFLFIIVLFSYFYVVYDIVYIPELKYLSNKMFNRNLKIYLYKTFEDTGHNLYLSKTSLLTFRGKLLLSRKLRYFRGSRFSQYFIPSTSPITRYQERFYANDYFE